MIEPPRPPVPPAPPELPALPEPPAPPARKTIDVSGLRALAHPLRVELLDQLSLYGPATASQLGRRLGENSGSTSYHLRQLARHGLIEDDDQHRAGRERWWRHREGGLMLHGHEFLRREDTRAAAQLVIREFQRGKDERLQRWMETHQQWGEEWIDASIDGVMMMRLDAAELGELVAELGAVIDRYRHRPARPGTESVEIQLNAFPNPPVGDAEPKTQAEAPRRDSTEPKDENR
ncbi:MULTISPECIES: winged helix-turn-helix domain-containing protein [Actinoalloteichus]|uniref:DNA binding protein with helix-turn-helix domain n=1 Tax=Actinoalloteichus fjordicus TaxID=1612552 RepID=A0AAC9LJS6_9PSEU|nr:MULTISPECIES: helix-turn-helix domain-containing protein [Actinoalloteichus]APU17549.1 DNA binding protein with helix-turn-helix domain [Actinoalloteichus fjordicus]APU23627.1 DNA binding protein with helix-turn-helix domain [Actinoalloteichus sp. GBA129-24]